MTAALKPPPIVVELVMGYAPAAWATCISTWTTASAPSQVVGIPGYWNFGGAASSIGLSWRVDFLIVAVLISALSKGDAHSCSPEIVRLVGNCVLDQAAATGSGRAVL